MMADIIRSNMRWDCRVTCAGVFGTTSVLTSLCSKSYVLKSPQSNTEGKEAIFVHGLERMWVRFWKGSRGWEGWGHGDSGE